MPYLPSGTVTFLFTDIEDSTRLWEVHPEAMRLALARHDAMKTWPSSSTMAMSSKPSGMLSALPLPPLPTRQ